MRKVYLTKTLSALSLVAMTAVAQAQLVTRTFTNNNTIQSFTVPQACGNFTIQAVGASGGTVSTNCTVPGGLGASMLGVFSFSPGTVLRIIAGGVGQTSGADAGGGGGSFVALAQGTVPVIVAGGGGGASNSLGSCTASLTNGMDASLTTSATASRNGSAAGGVNGNGGQLGGNTASSGGAGGGFYTDGGQGVNPSGGGKAFVNGGAGGSPNTVSTAGGFGGGGCSWSSGGGGGGGGGYSGGGTWQSNPYCGGGGGGSYNSGSSQVNVLASGPGEGYVTIMYNAGTAINATANTNVICEGESVNIGASGAGLVSYTWSTGSNSLNITVSPTADSSFIIAATNASNCVSYDTVFIDVNPLPDFTFTTSPTLLCVGNQATMTVAGAASYTWDNGPQSHTYVVSPDVTTVYNVTGTSPEGCISNATVEVVVNSNTLGVTPSSSICNGQEITLLATGAVTYSWINQSIFSLFPNTTVSPSVTTIYIVNGIDSYNCSLTNSVTVTVTPKPPVTLASTKTKVCKGDMITLNAGGANTYTFSAGVGGNGSTGTVIANIDIPLTYTVTGTSAGCTNSAATTVIVEKCTGLAESDEVVIKIFPNPATDQITAELSMVPAGSSLEVYNQAGQLVKSITAESNNVIDLRSISAGIYFILLRNGEGSASLGKFVKD